MPNRIAHRPQQIIMDVLKPDTPPIITLIIQKLELDEENNVIAISASEDRLHKQGLKILTDSIEFSDPVTGLTGKISIAGMQQIMSTWANKWISEQLACPINSETGWTTCELEHRT